MKFPLSRPYPPEQPDGYWGIPTSTIDWCEENYVVSNYIAEAINTTTNAFFMALAIFATITAHRNHLGTRFVFASLGFLLVGFGSWWFHMTLRYEYQLLDELPMIYATCIPFWSVFSEFKSRSTSALIGLGIFAFANGLCFVYLNIYTNPTLHQTAYALLNLSIVTKSIFLSNKYVQDPAARRRMSNALFSGLGFFLLGYILWNADIHFCDYARATRREWGMPYGFLLEGHGWWHIFTGTGVYYYIVYQEYLRCFLQGTQEFYAYEYFYGIPIVRLKDKEGLLAFRREEKILKIKKNL